MLNLDTHIFLRAINGELSRSEEDVLARDNWGISSIVLWEIEKLWQKKRIQTGLDHPAVSTALADLRQIWPITPEVALNLRRLDFHSDPADELIAATSLTFDLPLVTRDDRLRASRVVRCLPE